MLGMEKRDEGAFGVEPRHPALWDWGTRGCQGEDKGISAYRDPSTAFQSGCQLALIRVG